VTGSTPHIPGVPAGTRAAALPDSALDLPSGFLASLGRPVRESACECERSNDVQLGPIMSLLGGPVVADAIADPANAVVAMVRDIPDDRALAEHIVLRVLGRPARPAELVVAETMQRQLADDHEALKASLAAEETAWAPARVAAEIARDEAIHAATIALQVYEPEATAKAAAAAAAREQAIVSAESAVTAHDDGVAAAVDAWSHPHAGADAPVWHPARVVKTTGPAGTEFTVEPDQSILVGGAMVNGDYVVDLEPSIGRITGVVIEALKDDRLPTAGPGRAPNGNFVLNQLAVGWTSLRDPAQTGKLEFAGARATFSQDNFDPADVIKPNADGGKGWAMGGAPTARQSAAFVLQSPLEQPHGVRLTVTLRFRYPDNQHLLGRFRIWVTSAADPLPAGIPEPVRDALAIVPPHRTPEHRATVIAEAAALDATRGALLQAVVAARQPVAPDPQWVERQSALVMANQPVPVPAKIQRLREDMAESIRQVTDRRLTAAQDLVWALINSPEFLFNH